MNAAKLYGVDPKAAALHRRAGRARARPGRAGRGAREPLAPGLRAAHAEAYEAFSRTAGGRAPAGRGRSPARPARRDRRTASDSQVARGSRCPSKAAALRERRRTPARRSDRGSTATARRQSASGGARRSPRSRRRAPRRQGELRELAVTGESGGTVSRRFCPTCGSRCCSGIERRHARTEGRDASTIRAGSRPCSRSGPTARSRGPARGGPREKRRTPDCALRPFRSRSERRHMARGKVVIISPAESGKCSGRARDRLDTTPSAFEMARNLLPSRCRVGGRRRRWRKQGGRCESGRGSESGATRSGARACCVRPRRLACRDGCVPEERGFEGTRRRRWCPRMPRSPARCRRRWSTKVSPRVGGRYRRERTVAYAVWTSPAPRGRARRRPTPSRRRARAQRDLWSEASRRTAQRRRVRPRLLIGSPLACRARYRSAVPRPARAARGGTRDARLEWTATKGVVMQRSLLGPPAHSALLPDLPLRQAGQPLDDHRGRSRRESHHGVGLGMEDRIVDPRRRLDLIRRAAHRIGDLQAGDQVVVDGTLEAGTRPLGVLGAGRGSSALLGVGAAWATTPRRPTDNAAANARPAGRRRRARATLQALGSVQLDQVAGRVLEERLSPRRPGTSIGPRTSTPRAVRARAPVVDEARPLGARDGAELARGAAARARTAARARSARAGGGARCGSPRSRSAARGRSGARGRTC